MVVLRLAGTRTTTTTTTRSTVPFCVPEGTSSQKTDQNCKQKKKKTFLQAATCNGFSVVLK